MNKSVIIIGGGVIGLCSAYYAQAAGLRVTVIERGGPTHDSCSLGNAGMIVPSHIVPLAAPGMVGMGVRTLFDREGPFAIQPRLSPELAGWGLKFIRSCTEEHVARSAPLLRDLSLMSRCLFEELSGSIGDFGLTQRGLLMLCKTAHGLAEENKSAERANALGVPAEILTPKEAQRLDPTMTMDIVGAVYFPKDCHLTPRSFVAQLTERLQGNGVSLRWNTEAIGWKKDTAGNIVAVKTTQGDIVADEYVLAGGAWSSRIARDLALNLPMQSGKGYSVSLTDPPQRPALCSILTEARVAVTPMGEMLRFGGTMELGGLELSLNINERRVRGILKSIPHYFPKFAGTDLAGLPVWSGLRPCSPDGLPYLGRPARYANLIIATGHAMMGLSLAPVTGVIVSDLLTAKPPSLPIDALNPDRWS